MKMKRMRIRPCPKNPLLPIVCCFLQAWCCHVRGQNLDSLETVLRTQKLEPAEQAELYDRLSWGYMDVDTRKSFYYARKGIRVAEKERNLVSASKLHCNLGVAYDMASNEDSAMFCFGKALDFALRANSERQEARVYICIGNLYHGKGDHPPALEYYMKALPMLEKEGDPQRVAIVLHNIGAIYQNLYNPEQALKYFEQEERIAREMDDPEALGYALISIGDILLDTKKDTKKALDYALQAADIFRKTKNLYAESFARLTAAKVYYSDDDYAYASEHAERALRMAEELEYPNVIARAYDILSNISLRRGRYGECETFALKAWETDSSDINVSGNLIANIVHANSKMGNSEKAIAYFEKYRTLIYERATKEYQSTLSEMEVKYETEKKEQKIAALEYKNRQTVWMSVAGGVILLLASAFFVVRHRLAVGKRKLAEQQIKRLEREKQLAAAQAALDGENTERTRLARDLHDGLGGMLSVIKLNLYDIKKEATQGKEVAAHFDRTMGMFEESIAELRRVAHNMMPESLTRNGLKVSLTDFCAGISDAEFHYFGDGDRLDARLEVMVYRTALELVNNALRHAEARRIVVQIVQEPDRLSLTVQNDGCGFDTKAITSGTGLSNIRNRVEAYNGRMSVWSQPGKGTEINVEFEASPPALS